MHSLTLKDETIFKTILKNYLSTEDFLFLSFNTFSASDELLGFMGDHFKLKLTYKTDGIIKEALFFGKSLPVYNQFKNDYINQYGAFRREITLYTKVFSKFQDMEDDKIWHPKCFFCSNELLIFEDLSLKGFKMLDVFKTHDLQHCLIGLSTLARFHSETIIYEETQNKINKLIDNFDDILSNGLFNNNEIILAAVNVGLRIAEKSEKFGKNTVHFKTVSEKWHDVFMGGVEMATMSKTELNVINHLDLWNNNIMFQHNINGEPIQCVFVDYQASKFLPPSADVMSYLYINTTKDFRSKRENLLLNHYYDELKKELMKKNISICKILSINQFFNSCKNFRLWGLIHSIFLFQFVLLDNDVVVEILNDPDQFEVLMGEDRFDSVLHTMDNNSFTRERILSNIDELINDYIVCENL